MAPTNRGQSRSHPSGQGIPLYEGVSDCEKCVNIFLKQFKIQRLDMVFCLQTSNRQTLFDWLVCREVSQFTAS